jgi:DNA-binding IclR family transcriptional regulator
MTERKERLDAVGKVARIMDLLCSSQHNLSIRDIERETDIPRSTVHRFLASLEEQEWIYRDIDTDQYRPGIKFFLLHRNVSFYDELIRISDPVMRNLVEKTSQTSIISVMEGKEGLCIHTVEPTMSVKFVAHKGMKIPLQSGATGKILLAYCRKEAREKILHKSGYEKAAKLRRDIDEIRLRGYAISKEEWIEHAGDISVPLFDSKGSFVAQLGIAGLATSFDGREEELLEELQEAARKIGRSL